MVHLKTLADTYLAAQRQELCKSVKEIANCRERNTSQQHPLGELPVSLHASGLCPTCSGEKLAENVFICWSMVVHSTLLSLRASFPPLSGRQ